MSWLLSKNLVYKSLRTSGRYFFRPVSISTRPHKKFSRGGSRGGKTSGSPFSNSFSFQLFIIVGAMGAGYSLGKSYVTENVPADLFPAGSTTTLDKIRKSNNASKYGGYDKFKRCVLRILETQGLEIDQKNYENPALYDNLFISKDIANMMNCQESVQEVFLGKRIQDLDQKQYVFYPNSTKQVSAILKNCQEFHIPVFTSTSAYTSGLKSTEAYKLKIDFSRLNKIENVNKDSLRTQTGIHPSALYKEMHEMDFQPLSNLNALTILFSLLGIQLPCSRSRLLGNKIDKSLVESFTAVLPDGTIENVRRFSEDPSERQAFYFLLAYESSCCIITDVTIKRNIQDNYLFYVLGFKSLFPVDSTVNKIKSVIPDLEIAFVDSVKCSQLEKTFGGYQTLCAFKLNRGDDSRLSRYFNNNSKGFRVFKFKSKDLVPSDESLYFSDMLSPKANRSRKASSALIVSSDIVHEDPRTFYSITMPEEVDFRDSTDDKTNVNRDLFRRIKFSLDPAKVLNPNVEIKLEPNEDKTAN